MGWTIQGDTVIAAADSSGTANLKLNNGDVTDSSGNLKYVRTNTLGDLGISASSTELNYCKGVTSSIQTQLNAKASSSHNHAAGNITSGIFTIERGGTGASSSASALANLGAAAAAHNHAASSITSGILGVARGGTGQSSLQAALTSLHNGTNFILTTSAYGSNFPTSSLTTGRVFFKKVT